MEEHLHTTFCMKHDYLSDARIYSVKPVTEAQVEALTHAQTVVESMWLERFPAVAMLCEAPAAPSGVQLFDNVHLLLKEDWGLMDKADTFLVNERMLELCPSKEPPYVALNQVSSSAGLMELFDSHIFVVAGIYV